MNYTRKKLLKEIAAELLSDCGDALIAVAVFVAGMVALAGFGAWWLK